MGRPAGCGTEVQKGLPRPQCLPCPHSLMRSASPPGGNGSPAPALPAVTSGCVPALPGGLPQVHSGAACTVAFEMENNATLWPWLQVKQKLGPAARAAASVLLILARAPHPHPATPAVASVASPRSPASRRVVKGQRAGHFYCQLPQ